MGRILFFLLLGLALYVGFRVWRTGTQHAPGPPGRREEERSESMVRCDHCGLVLPSSEAIADGGHHFCSEAHRRLGHAPR